MAIFVLCQRETWNIPLLLSPLILLGEPQLHDFMLTLVISQLAFQHVEFRKTQASIPSHCLSHFVWVTHWNLTRILTIRKSGKLLHQIFHSSSMDTAWIIWDMTGSQFMISNRMHCTGSFKFIYCPLSINKFPQARRLETTMQGCCFSH
jgi:hypothetical protein